MSDAIKGVMLGGLLGGGLGLWASMSLFTDNLLFPGDTALLGAAIGGVAGFVWGDDFFDWLRDHWHRFF